MLTPKEKKQLTRIEATLAMPRWKFLLWYGLSFGILLVLFTSFIDVEFRGMAVADVWGRRLVFNLLTVAISGFFFAKIIHWLTVKKYLFLRQKEKGV